MKNLNVNALLLKDRPTRNPERPVNLEAMAKLTALYMATDLAKPRFTIEDCCMLGVLYHTAWGVLPTPGRLKAGWCMPDYLTIVGLFGDVIKYHVSINRYALNQPMP